MADTNKITEALRRLLTGDEAVLIETHGFHEITDARAALAAHDAQAAAPAVQAEQPSDDDDREEFLFEAARRGHRVVRAAPAAQAWTSIGPAYGLPDGVGLMPPAQAGTVEGLEVAIHNAIWTGRDKGAGQAALDRLAALAARPVDDEAGVDEQAEWDSFIVEYESKRSYAPGTSASQRMNLQDAAWGGWLERARKSAAALSARPVEADDLTPTERAEWADTCAKLKATETALRVCRHERDEALAAREVQPVAIPAEWLQPCASIPVSHQSITVLLNAVKALIPPTPPASQEGV